MIVNCEECGTRYRLDESKIKGSSAKVKCKSCGHVMLITKPDQESPAYQPEGVSGAAGRGEESAASTAFGSERSGKSEEKAATGTAGSEGTSQSRASAASDGSQRGQSRGAGASGRRARGWLGIRGKMFFLFVFLPIGLSLIAGYIYLNRVETLKDDYGKQVTEVVTQMGQAQVAARARSAAGQVGLYLSAHPNLKPDAFNRDSSLRRMAMLEVGQTGYTFLYQLPGDSDSWKVRMHPEQEMVGTDLTKEQVPSGFQKIIKNTSGGKEASGFYSVPAQSGEQAERFMFCAPVEGTEYVVAATIERGGMIQPAQVLNTQLDRTYTRMRNRTLYVLGGLAVFFLLIVFWFGHRLNRRIHNLTEVAERISVGDLEAEVEIKGKDEISSLAEAISRMQESVRLSIERLRRRRS